MYLADTDSAILLPSCQWDFSSDSQIRGEEDTEERLALSKISEQGHKENINWWTFRVTVTPCVCDTGTRETLTVSQPFQICSICLLKGSTSIRTVQQVVTEAFCVKSKA